jgi:hypothetical protein
VLTGVALGWTNDHLPSEYKQRLHAGFDLMAGVARFAPPKLTRSKFLQWRLRNAKAA